MARADQQSTSSVSFLPRGRALVVDQDRKDLQDYAGVLQGMGFEVKPFSNYHEASRCLEEEAADFVFVSQGTRAFEARVVVERALAVNRHTPVVVMAHSLDMGCYLEAMQLGAADYVEKPLAPADMEYLVTTHSQPRVMAMRRTA
jgi:two-component system, NtrC family, phosphoglycerate transport system response regulator PgtA